MSTHRVSLEAVLSPDEITKLDVFCAAHPGVESLPALAEFLKQEFHADLSLDPDIVVGFATDSSNLPGRADGVCRPSDERECSLFARACFQSGIPYVISGGKSNLTGSATADGGVVIAMERMVTPEVAVDEASMTVRAPVGIILEDLRNEVLAQTAKRLYFPVDPTSRTDAFVGGALACNASGFFPGEIGSIRHWIEDLDFILPDGMKISAKRGQYVSQDGVFVLVRPDGTEAELPVPRHPRAAIKNAGGPYSSPDGVMDFVDLVVGSEGLFGFMIACTLKVAKSPDDHLDLFFSLPSEEQVVQFRNFLDRRLEGGLGTLSALEYFGPNARTFMDHEERLFHGDNPVALYVQIPLHNREVEDAAEEWLEILMESGCDIDEDAIMLLDNDRDRSVLIEARHSLPSNYLEYVRQRGTFAIITDALVPAEAFPEFLAYSHGLIQEAGIEYLLFGHIGDCHLHYHILPTAEQLEAAAAIYDKIVAKSAELGGVYSGEHGTGKRKRNDFLLCHGQTGVDEVRKTKQAVDPDFLLNRGNVIEYTR